MQTKRPAKKPKRATPMAVWVVRALLLITVILIFATLLAWRSLATEYERGEKLSSDGKYDEAERVMAPLLRKPLAAVRIREKALAALQECRMRMASEIARKDESVESYTNALTKLEEARKLYGTSRKLEQRIKRYKESRDVLIEMKKPKLKEEPIDVKDAAPGMT